jgi:hypothetical protein
VTRRAGRCLGSAGSGACPPLSRAGPQLCCPPPRRPLRHRHQPVRPAPPAPQ